MKKFLEGQEEPPPPPDWSSTKAAPCGDRPSWHRFTILELGLLVLMSGLCFAIIRAIAMRPQTVPVGFLLPIIGFIYGPIHIGIEFRRGRLEPLRLGELVWVLQLVAVFGVFPVGFLVFSELQDLQGRLGAWGPVSGLLLIIIGFPAAVAFAVFELALPFLCILGLVTYLLPKVDNSPVLWTEVAGFVFGVYGLVPLGIMCEVLAPMP